MQADDNWRGIVIETIPEVARPGLYRVTFFPEEPAEYPGAEGRGRIPRSATIFVRVAGRPTVVDYVLPESLPPGLKRGDYEAKALQAVAERLAK